MIEKKDGKETGRMISEHADEGYLTDSLAGILKGIPDPDDARERELKEKYGSGD